VGAGLQDPMKNIFREAIRMTNENGDVKAAGISLDDVFGFGNLAVKDDMPAGTIMKYSNGNLGVNRSELMKVATGEQSVESMAAYLIHEAAHVKFSKIQYQVLQHYMDKGLTRQEAESVVISIDEFLANALSQKIMGKAFDAKKFMEVYIPLQNANYASRLNSAFAKLDLYKEAQSIKRNVAVYWMPGSATPQDREFIETNLTVAHQSRDVNSAAEAIQHMTANHIESAIIMNQNGKAEFVHLSGRGREEDVSRSAIGIGYAGKQYLGDLLNVMTLALLLKHQTFRNIFKEFIVNNNIFINDVFVDKLASIWHDIVSNIKLQSAA